MTEVATYDPQRLRMRQLVWPREHGAWGILAIPLVTGIGVGLLRSVRPWPTLVFAVAAFAAFCLRTPLESLLGNTPMRAQTRAERKLVSKYLAIFAGVAVLSVAFLFREGLYSGLLLLGVVAALLFLAQAMLRSRGQRMAAQLTGAFGLTSTAAGAYYVSTGHWDVCALVLWIVNWIFAANQVHFVQLRIHAAKRNTTAEKLATGWPFLAGQFLMLLLLLVAWHSSVLPGFALLAFVPVFARGALWFVSRPQPLRVRRLGFTELAHGLAFGVLIIVAFAV